MDISKRDWQLFRAKLPEWQERYMDALNQSYIELLSRPGKASEKFWALEERIKRDKRHSGVMAAVSRSNMMHILLELRMDGAITDGEMSEFSQEVQDVIDHFCKEYGHNHDCR